jgi:hypothetical protein
MTAQPSSGGMPERSPMAGIHGSTGTLALKMPGENAWSPADMQPYDQSGR